MDARRSDVGVAALAADSAGGRAVELRPADRVRGASIAKPLLAWAAAALPPFADDLRAWRALAQPAITTSNNEATAALWSRAGGQHLLESLAERLGLRWEVGGEGEHESLRLMVTADELAIAYAALASDRSAAGLDVRQWMREVPTAQTFGTRQVAAETLAVAETSIGVKCAWFGGVRAHAVVLVDLPDRTVGAVVTTTLTSDATTSAEVANASGDDARLVAIHDVLAGATIRAAVHSALVASRSL